MTLKQENEQRAQRARNLVDAYIAENGGDGESVLRDMLADLMHMAAIDCECPDFEKELDAARMHFRAETEPGDVYK
jgi:hypothetical protein